MSTSASPQPQIPAATEREEVTIVSHSGLFYWWPVWAVGFIMALYTYFDGHRLAIVPKDTVPELKRDVQGHGQRDVLIVQPGEKLPADPSNENKPLEPRLRLANSSFPGVLWAIVLLLVIVITNVPLRGLWSVVIIIAVVLLSVIFALAGWWEHILHALYVLDIRINMGGYLFISLVLFGLWVITVFIFDKQVYMIFSPGQLRVCQEIGGGETAYDTQGMVVNKQQSDLFRHWILGLGSGDLVVRTAGANTHEFNLHNVLFVGHKLRQIERMKVEKAVVRGG